MFKILLVIILISLSVFTGCKNQTNNSKKIKTDTEIELSQKPLLLKKNINKNQSKTNCVFR